ncbi:MAG: MFS transporter [Anaerolineae bacterium]
MQEQQRRWNNWKAPFFTLWSVQALSLVGSRVAQFALIWWLTERTGSAKVLAYATACGLVPEIVLGPFAGAYVDRWNRRTVMIVADGLIALASLWLALMFWTGAAEIYHVYIIMVLRAIGGSFHWPAMQSSTSLMVPKSQLTRVAGMNQAMYGGLGILGPALGGLLLELLPLHGVMLVDVGTALVAIMPLFFIFIPQPERKSEEVVTNVFADLRLGLSYIAAWPGMVVLVIAALIFKIALTPAFSLIPLLVSEHFGGDAPQLSLLESTAGVGILLGGVILSAWGGFHRKIHTTLLGMCVVGLGLLGMGVVPASAFLAAVGAIFVVGLSIPFIDGPIMAILQSTVSPEMQGRVFSMLGSLLSLSSPFSLAVAGPISDWLGLQIWFVVAGILCGVIGVAGFFIPALVHIEENANGEKQSTETQPQETFEEVLSPAEA